MDLRRRFFDEFEPLKEIWHSPWVGIPLWMLAAGITICWIFAPPPPGYAIGLLGAVAGVMSVREIKTLGKISWIVLLIRLLITEFRAIDKDRADSAKESLQQRTEQDTRFQAVLDAQNEDFSATARSLKQAYSQNQKQFDATMGGISTEINTFTGGNSYVALNYAPGQGFLFFDQIGGYPLFSVTARIVDIGSPIHDLFGTIIQLGDLTQGHGLMRPVPPELNRSIDQLNLNIFFTARNGDWIEQLRERRTNDGWKRVILIEGAFSSMKKGKKLCQTIDKNFPMDSLDKNILALFDPMLPRCQ